MKNVSWIWVILLPVITLLFPELANVGDATQTLATFAGYVGLVTIITEGVKRLIKIDWVYFPEVASLIVALLIAFAAWIFKVGIFSAVDMVWYHVVFLAIVATGAANRWYDITLKEPTVKLIQ